MNIRLQQIFLLLIFTWPLSGITVASQTLIVTSEPAQLVAASDLSKQANLNWLGLPNKFDPQQLDTFITNYPNARHSMVAFNLRYRLLLGLKAQALSDPKNIPETKKHFAAFIDRYTGTWAAQQALADVFELVRRQDSLEAYLSFMWQYPTAPQALVAKAFAEQRAFEQVIQAKTNPIQEAEDFIGLFPTAPQVTTVIRFAHKHAIAEEQQFLATKLAPYEKKIAFYAGKKAKLDNTSSDDMATQLMQLRMERAITSQRRRQELVKNNRAQKLCRKIEMLASEADHLSDQKDLASQALASTKWRQFERIAAILYAIYDEQPATECVRDERIFQRIIAKIEAIRQTIIASNDKVIAVIREEFQKTRQQLQDGFEQLHKDNLVLQERYRQLLQGVEQLHVDLQQVNTNLRAIHNTTIDIVTAQQQSNAHLRQLHTDLTTVQSGLTNLQTEMNQGMAAEQALLKQVAGELNQGFSTLHHDLKSAEAQAQRLHSEMMVVGEKNITGTYKISDTLKRNHLEALKAEHEQTKTLVNQMQSSTEAMVTAQNDITKAVHTNTQVSIRNTEQQLASQRKTQQLIRKQGQAMKKVASARSSSGGGGGGVLGTVASVIGRFF
ncbi:hypothetical protein TI05_07335 [Achromatium sp. WMS3]|nr:hypothetical protein TI05_07335 [Achromatium sp. WMS3]